MESTHSLPAVPLSSREGCHVRSLGDIIAKLQSRHANGSRLDFGLADNELEVFFNANQARWEPIDPRDPHWVLEVMAEVSKEAVRVDELLLLMAHLQVLALDLDVRDGKCTSSRAAELRGDAEPYLTYLYDAGEDVESAIPDEVATHVNGNADARTAKVAAKA